MKSFSQKMKFGGLAFVAVSTLALATVTFDPSTGTGFVGKGDVCLALGITKCKNPPTVSFAYSEKARFLQDCVKDGEHHTTYHTFQRRSDVLSALNSLVRNQGPNASSNSSPNEGWFLLGYANTVQTWTDENGYPVNGSSGNLCPSIASGWEPDPAGTNGGQIYQDTTYGGSALTVTDGVTSGVLTY